MLAELDGTREAERGGIRTITEAQGERLTDADVESEWLVRLAEQHAIPEARLLLYCKLERAEAVFALLGEREFALEVVSEAYALLARRPRPQRALTRLLIGEISANRDPERSASLRSVFFHLIEHFRRCSSQFIEVLASPELQIRCEDIPRIRQLFASYEAELSEQRTRAQIFQNDFGNTYAHYLQTHRRGLKVPTAQCSACGEELLEARRREKNAQRSEPKVLVFAACGHSFHARCCAPSRQLPDAERECLVCDQRPIRLPRQSRAPDATITRITDIE